MTDPLAGGPIITERDKVEEVRSEGLASLIETAVIFKRPAIAVKTHHHALGSDDAIFRLSFAFLTIHNFWEGVFEVRNVRNYFSLHARPHIIE